MGKLKIIDYHVESGETVHVAQKLIKTIERTAIITRSYIKNGNLKLEYRSKRGKAHGSMEVYDMEVFFR